MPANLTPEYFKAEKWYREAVTNEEKILAVERMLAVMPKHKGTDHLKADLRRKLSKLKEAATQKTGTAKTADIFYIPKTGAAQISLIGTPNSGKSSILASLTNARVNVADFPYATNVPVPGMVRFEDIQIQLIDTPPITADFVTPGQVGVYRNCDLIAIVIDLSEDIEKQLNILLDFLESRNLLIDENTPAADSAGNRFGKAAFYLCTKADIAKPSALENLKKISKHSLPVIVTSTETNEGIDTLPQELFKLSNIIRVYTKPPGKKADLTEPFTLPAGSTIMDLANAIHRELAEKFSSAKIWGTVVYDGQNAPKDHVLHDKDIVELHFT
jgi:ribosome-interacting GTPase 1